MSDGLYRLLNRLETERCVPCSSISNRNARTLQPLLDSGALLRRRRGRGMVIEVKDAIALHTFQQQLFPGSDHIHTPSPPENPESSYLRPTPYGEMFDVLLSSARAETLSAYPVILLVGDHAFDPQFVCDLFEALRAGSRLLVHERHVEALGKDWPPLQGSGHVEVLKRWVHPKTQRPAAIPNERLALLRDSLLPVLIEGDPVQYQVNRTQTSWIIEIINNEGIIKKPTEPAKKDATKIAQVTLTPRVPVSHVTVWGTENSRPAASPLHLAIPPGETRFVELECFSN